VAKFYKYYCFKAVKYFKISDCLRLQVNVYYGISYSHLVSRILQQAIVGMKLLLLLTKLMSNLNR